mgnify:FL=1
MAIGRGTSEREPITVAEQTVEKLKSADNLMEAFTGESEANRKYLAYAKQAEKEGKLNAARLFRAVAEAETIHAHKWLERAKKIGTTEENLADAIAGEQHEATVMYPDFGEVAEHEGNKSLARAFRMVGQVEGIHADRFGAVLEALATDSGELVFYVCPYCGNVELERPDKCSVCGVPGDTFIEIA